MKHFKYKILATADYAEKVKDLGARAQYLSIHLSPKYEIQVLVDIAEESIYVMKSGLEHWMGWSAQ